MSRPCTTSDDRAPGVLTDLVALSKPSIVAMNVLMTAGAYLLAGTSIDILRLLAALTGSALAVGSANALNMYLERDSDRLMARTRHRPLPAGRLAPRAALAFGLVIGVSGVALLALAVNGLTALIGVGAIVLYVWGYTPLKRRSPLALLVGAVPGAAPPLMGWTAATGRVDEAGLVLFATLFLWQLPHFLAIALYRKPDYARAGIRTVPVVRGDRAAKAQAVAYSLALLPTSLALVPLGVAGWVYFALALPLGLWFLAGALRGLGADAGILWARRFFLSSLVYLPALVVALLADASVGLLS